ncbi:MAG: M20/M25/M40 family metallo-hydrolase [Rhizobiaceae bacterium]
MDRTVQTGHQPTRETGFAEDAVALLRGLVEAESINPPGDTTGPVSVMSAWLDKAGLSHEVLAADPTKPNIVATLDNGSGPHLVFNAHLDTVAPGDLAAWAHPPLQLSEKDGKLYGLGTGNMKASAAALAIAYGRLAARRQQWAGRLTLTLVADECVFGPDGAAHLLDTRPDLVGDMLICGEGPGAMNLAVAEKGLLWIRLTATGPVGQGMLAEHRGTATARLAEALCRIDAWNRRVVPCPLPELDNADNAAGMRMTVNIGRIGGGTYFSHAASQAWAEIDFRIPPGLTLEDMARDLDELCAADHLSWETVKGWNPNWSQPRSDVAAAVSGAAASVRGKAPALVTRLPASDASRWRARGVPAVCFGAQPELASGVDDYVHRSDFLDCCDIYTGAALHLLARPAAAQTAE